MNRDNKIVSVLSQTHIQEYTHASARRINAVDIQRGIIMLLMAFTHSREYLSTDQYSNLKFDVSPDWLGKTITDIITQLFATTVVTGGFFMMMGLGIIFLFHSRIKDGWSLEKTCLYLIKRGFLLILIQLTILQCFEIMATRKLYFYAGVLLTLGIDMIFASLCLYLIQKLKLFFLLKNNFIEYLIPLFFILLITFFTQLLMNHLQTNSTRPSFWMIALILGGHYQMNIDIDINFTPIVWFPPVALGLMIGQLMYDYRDKSYNLIFKIALAFLFSWLVLRSGNLLGWFNFGDYKPILKSEQISCMSYFCMAKYPPSVTFLLYTLGLNLLGIAVWQKINGALINIFNPIKLFGQCALFFFVLHWFVYYGISLLLHSPVSNAPAFIGLWILGLVPLYFMCQSYYTFKAQQSPDSIWRML